MLRPPRIPKGRATCSSGLSPRRWQLASQLASPVVLVLDDLQWADVPSLQLLRHVVATTETLRMLVIGTFRESDLPAGHPLADLLGALHREPGTEAHLPSGLNDLELLAMMEGAAGQEMDEDETTLRNALVAETDGNPFFAGEFPRHLAETGAIYLEQAGGWARQISATGGCRSACQRGDRPAGGPVGRGGNPGARSRFR